MIRPSYRPLIDICKNSPQDETSCLKIAEILKQYGDNKNLFPAEKSELDHKNHYECLSQIMNNGSQSYFINGQKIIAIDESIEHEFGEIALYKKSQA